MFAMFSRKQALAALLSAGFGLLVAVWPVWAHHTFAVEYDSKKMITLKGQVIKVDWRNPHAYLYIEAKDAKGVKVNWALEGAPATKNMQAGWKKDSLKKGDIITVTAHPARDGSNRAAAREVSFPDGETMVFGSPGK
jgi:hypothetical protein